MFMSYNKDIRLLMCLLLAAWGLCASAQPKLTVVSDVVNVGDVMFQQPKRVAAAAAHRGTCFVWLHPCDLAARTDSPW